MEPNTTTIASGLEKVRGRIKEVAAKAGRDPESITLLAASKTNPAECLREAFAAGQTIFGYTARFITLYRADEMPLDR